ncbi:hypothetical protein [Micavibrio aeruginosavorus]|uniref:hypothetical protein n=1 Tax=Micavibrio aeruginosavorus TaxID=349221 RepID=UPI003F4AB02D
MKKHIIFWVLILGAVGLLGMILLKSYGAQLDSERMNQGVDALFMATNMPADTPAAQWPDIIRQFVAAHVQIDQTKPLNGNSGAWVETIGGMLLHVNKHSQDRPAINPATAAQLMGLMLKRAGVEARIVELFRYAPGFPSTPMVETKDADTGQWVLHDPARDVYWANPQKRERVGLETIVRDRAQNFMPCNMTTCDWALVSQTGVTPQDMMTYFVLGVAYDPTDPVMFVNNEQFSLTSPVTGTNGAAVSFCQVQANLCALRKVDY